MKNVLYTDLGLIDYKECWDRQTAIFDRIVAQKWSREKEGRQPSDDDAKPTLILCEHPHVYTLGKSGAQAKLLITDEFLKNINATYYHIDRGGDITYHGPGQLVGYPILDLDELGLGLKDYIHALEQAVIDTLAAFGISSERSSGATGVWLPADAKGTLRKICAIGVRSSHFVTMHGFALNVNTMLEYFSYINPCGFTDRGVTSMEKELTTRQDMERVKREFCTNFERLFGVKLTA